MISTLMLTTPDRWWFQSLAIEQFLSQGALEPTDELVVVIEEGADPMPVAPQHEALNAEVVRVVTIPPQSSLPAKRNLGMAACRRNWVAFWDDDDWHGFDRLRHLKVALHSSGGRCGIYGQQVYYQHELLTDRRNTYRYEYGKNKPERLQSEPYVVGGTMMFDKLLWKKDPFVEEVTKGDEGWWTLKRLRDDHVPYHVMSPGDYVAMIHGRNTCAKAHRVDEHDFVMSCHYTTVVREPDFLWKTCHLPPSWLRRFEAAAWAELDRDRG